MDYQVMPPLSEEEYGELKDDIAKRGVMVPIEYDECGNILDGHHRVQICEELGIMDFPKIIRSGMTEDEKRIHARKLNMARRHLNRVQKQELIREQLRETPGKSNVQIANALGVTDKTVAVQRRALESTSEIPRLEKTIGADGKERMSHIENKQSIIEPDEYPSEIGETYVCHDEDCAYIFIDAYGNAEDNLTGKKPHVVNNSKDDEWYTPARYIDAAREVMGSIDLDPASNDFANQTVKASEYYTEETNGLLKEWYGNIWMNPPYSTALLSQFAEKLASSSFNQAIILVNNATETSWFARMIEKASAVVFHKGRIRFVKRDGEHGTPLQGQAFIYYGDSPDRFLDVFGEFGWGAML